MMCHAVLCRLVVQLSTVYAGWQQNRANGACSQLQTHVAHVLVPLSLQGDLPDAWSSLSSLQVRAQVVDWLSPCWGVLACLMSFPVYFMTCITPAAMCQKVVCC
jgi:hypothetical protein